MAKRFNWANALCAETEAGRTFAIIYEEHLGFTQAEIIAGIRSVPGSYIHPRSAGDRWTPEGSEWARRCHYCLPKHPQYTRWAGICERLTFVYTDPSEYFAVKARLMRRWARGNFAVPRWVSQALREEKPVALRLVA